MKKILSTVFTDLFHTQATAMASRVDIVLMEEPTSSMSVETAGVQRRTVSLVHWLMVTVPLQTMSVWRRWMRRLAS